MITLKQLLQGISHWIAKGSTEIEITGVTSQSKLIQPGYLFIAKKGRSYDGADYIQEAIALGASAVITSSFSLSTLACTLIIHPEVEKIEALLSANFYKHPSGNLLMVGITGTNGKTTTSFIVKNLLDAFEKPCGLIGTIENIIGKHHFPAVRTTPDVTTNQQLLSEMVQEGCLCAAMEVSSHALDQDRVEEIDFDVAVFSNLTLDHLDYHQTMEKYCKAKNRLFATLGQKKSPKKGLKWAIANEDSRWTASILENCTANILTYGIERTADLQASEIFFTPEGTTATITYGNEAVKFKWPFVGRFNVYNCLAAIGVLLTQNISLKEISKKMIDLPSVPGRLQIISINQGPSVYVDYAHSDDALTKVLEALREIKPADSRLLVVFGCGGDRDRSKRPKMAQVCEKLADACVVTSDNPRSEDPVQICAEITAGFSSSFYYEVEINRFLAIKKIFELARPHDLVLIAGKGHETYQIFSDRTIEFDDSKVARDVMKSFLF